MAKAKSSRARPSSRSGAKVEYPLARQSGINSPKSEIVRYSAHRYAISIHASDLDRYADKVPIELGDDT